MSDDLAMMPISKTRAEVAAQPEVLARVLRDLHPPIESLAQELALREVNLVLASGSGDSWFAAQAVRLAWEHYAGVAFEGLQAYEYAAYGRPGINSRTAHFVISSSGRPTTTWDALDRALATDALVIGITDNPSASNPFVAKPPHALIPQGEKAGWPAQTTTATIAVLLNLAVAFGKARDYLSAEKSAELQQQLHAIPAQITGVLQASTSWAEAVVATVDEKPIFTFVGGGPSFAAAQNGSALLAAGPQEYGMALTVEEFHHALRIGTIRQGEPVVLIAPNGAVNARNADTVRVVREWGARIFVIATPETAHLAEAADEAIVVPSVAEPMSPLLTIPVLHALSIALAEKRVADGYHRPKSVPQ